ncbi:hypothetical protein AB0I61_35160 [Polymorphospora rubra]|uniref:hypothetical protein n=1 Tax=Polymorphospora rubra TaxID=338584 RepID=UPI0033E81FF0
MLVLGARVDPDGTPSSILAAPLELARQLYESRTARVILASGEHRLGQRTTSLAR